MLAILAILTPKGALRVAPGCSGPLLPSVARRGLDTIGPGQGSRRVSRTGKLNFGQCRLDHGVPLWVEGDGLDGCPIAGLAAPAPWVVLACRLIECVSCIEQLAIFAGMALCRCDVTDATVPMVMVVPLDEGYRPDPRDGQIGKALWREFRPVLGGAEQRLGVNVTAQVGTLSFLRSRLLQRKPRVPSPV